MLYYIKTIQARKIFLLWSFDTPQFALMCVLWSLPVLICNYWCAEFCASIIENLLVLHVNVRLARPVALTLCIDPFTDRELFRILPTLEDIGNFFRKIYFWTICATNTSNICFNMLNLTIKYIWVKVLAILALRNKMLVNFIYQLFLPAPSWIWPIRERAYELTIKTIQYSDLFRICKSKQDIPRTKQNSFILNF